jgi:hypothetical protein
MMATNAPLVYIVQDNPLHSYWPAEKFGTLKHCLSRTEDYVLNRGIVRLRAALLNFNPDTDYLLLSGSPLMTGVACAILHERADKIRVLRWSAQDQNYWPDEVDFTATSWINGDDQAA